MKKYIFCALISLVFCQTQAQEISLNGKWAFALDPLQRGEVHGWQKGWIPKKVDSLDFPAGFDKVTVPHAWSVDVRYNFVGKAWYRKSFMLPPEAKEEKVVQLHFEAVFYKCRIFVNDKIAAFHEGGYTPFTVDISKYLNASGLNFLSVEVDNSWDAFTIPGARLADNPASQVYPWYEFGGIIRDVSLIMTNKIYLSNQKIEASPNLKTGTATLKVISWLENKAMRDSNITLKTIITHRQTGKQVQLGRQLTQNNSSKAYTQQKVVMVAEMKAEDVVLWDFDNPNLYDAHTIIETAGKEIGQYDTYFGIREFKVQGVQLLLNGKPIRVAGANRQLDHPQFGSIEPLELAKQDMSLQRNGNMIFARLSHTPTSRHFYQWADENGYLIVTETPNWQIVPVLMANRTTRDLFKAQMQELIENFWNSPSIVAYSVGNEYASWTPEGDEWTRYQIEACRQLDSTRLMTFVAIGTAAHVANLKVPYDGFRHCDFLNFNNYSAAQGLENNLQNIHKKYPNKPIFISETGMRADEVKSEQDRIDHLSGIIDVIKRNPYAVGFSYWTFNDYLSRYVNSNASGYRPWGIVDEKRQPRDLYKAFQTQLSPVTVKIEKDIVFITAKSDFPSYTIKNHVLKVMEGVEVKNTYRIPEIGIGKTVELKINKTPTQKLIIENSKGFSVYHTGL